MSAMLFLGGFGGWEWVVIAVLGLLLFGKKLPGIARSLGQSVVEFKKGIKGVKDEIDDASNKSIEDKSSSNKTIDVAASAPAAETAEAKAE